MLTSNEPPKVTLLLVEARVLLLLDWLNTAKDFILSSTDFVAPGNIQHDLSFKMRIPASEMYRFMSQLYGVCAVGNVIISKFWIMINKKLSCS